MSIISLEFPSILHQWGNVSIATCRYIGCPSPVSGRDEIQAQVPIMPLPPNMEAVVDQVAYLGGESRQASILSSCQVRKASPRSSSAVQSAPRPSNAPPSKPISKPISTQTSSSAMASAQQSLASPKPAAKAVAKVAARPPTRPVASRSVMATRPNYASFLRSVIGVPSTLHCYPEHVHRRCTRHARACTTRQS